MALSSKDAEASPRRRMFGRTKRMFAKASAFENAVEGWIDHRAGAGAYRANWAKYKPYFLIVIVPTFVAALYYYLIAADQYLSEAHFIVMGTSGAPSANALSQILGSSTGAGDTQTLAVLDFMESHDAVSDLRSKIDLTGIYRKPWLDVLGRMSAHPTIEGSYRYLFRFGQMIDPYYDFTSGVGVLKVYAFDPNDARTVADTLLDLGDRMVDRLNERSDADALRASRAEVKRAEIRVVAAEQKITGFQLRQRALDLTKSSGTVLDVIGQLEGQLAAARADLTAQSSYLRPDSPAFKELRNKVSAIESQIADQQARLTGPNGGLAPNIANFQQLTLEREFANQEYQLALKSLEDAYVQAQKQHLFLVRTVDANAPDESEYPRRAIIVLSVFVVLTVAYGIGWLIIAGVREHAG
jgi:capsular polysaccharide transport system permease protein